jgi:hypothetical protein
MRIFLDEVSTRDLHTMLKEMRKLKGVSLSPSELGSWVLEFFFKTQFEKAKPEIAKRFTDFKKLVRDNLKTASSQEELIHSLKDTLMAAQTIKAIKKTTDKVEVKTNKEEIKDK